VRKRQNKNQEAVTVDVFFSYLLDTFTVVVLSILFANGFVSPSDKNSRLGAKILDKTAKCLWQFLPLLVIKLFL